VGKSESQWSGIMHHENGDAHATNRYICPSKRGFRDWGVIETMVNSFSVSLQ
jgi:hypothetical protein